MTKTDIIQQIFREHIITKFANKFLSFIGECNIEDFCQYIYMILLELPDEKLIGLHERNELFYYVYYIVKAQATNKSSSFHKLYSERLETVELTENLNNET